MAYDEYKDSGKSLGKVLYQLSSLGIPLRIVESVVLKENGKLCYGQDNFAIFKWNEQDTPIFQFQVPYDCYCNLDQGPVYTLMVSRDFGATFEEGCIFSFVNPYVQPSLSMGHEYYILDKNGNKVDDKLKPIMYPKSTIEDRFKLLQSKFSKA